MGWGLGFISGDEGVGFISGDEGVGFIREFPSTQYTNDYLTYIYIFFLLVREHCSRFYK